MITLTFTEEEIAVFKPEKNDTPFPKVRRRCEGVYLKSQGFKHQEIENIIGISHGTVTSHLKRDQQGGIDALKTLNYQGQPSQLHRDTEQLKDSLEQHPVGPFKEARARSKDLTGLE